MERLSRIEEGSAQLEVDGRTLTLPGALRDAWRHEGWLLVMARLEGGLALLVYDAASLEERRRIPPPAGWSFDRLTRDVRGGPSALAWTPAAIHGHHDWHLAIDPGAGTLTRTDPSR